MLAVLSDYGNGFCRHEEGEFVDSSNEGISNRRYVRVTGSLYAGGVQPDRRSLL